MKGLEIIEHIAIEQIPESTITCLILGVFSILIPTVWVYMLTKDLHGTFITEIIAGFIYIIFIVAVLESGIFEKPTGKYQYKVNITEDVDYVEFTDKYNIIAKNDDGTYIIQEKD